MNYFSLFSGIGGFELGFQQAYEDIKIKSSNSTDHSGGTPQYTRCPLCVGYSEIDKYAIQIYEKHFPTHKNYGDITKIDPEGLSDFELLCGGFPCQSFSIAGKRGGFEDTRGTLFFDIARIAKVKRPRLLLLENVKGLLSHDEGRTFNTIIATLDELGYDLQWQVLNSKSFGVPQNRERVFIIGSRRGTRRPNVFPLSCEYEQNTINEKVYQMSESVSSYARKLLVDLSQSKRQKVSREQMQDLFQRVRKGIQNEECSEIEREPQEIRQQPKRDIQEIETLRAFLGSADDTGGICGVVRVPTEEMLLLWTNRGDALQSFLPIQQPNAQDDGGQNRQQKTLLSWEHSPLLLAVQPYQGRLFYSIGDGRDWFKIYQTKMEIICKENSLSSILEEHPDPKYFLSEKQMKGLIGTQS